MRELDDSELDMLGIFHSHTHTQAYPSSTDVNLAANWPEAYYLIASLMNEAPLLRAFRIVNGQVTEEDISIQD
jgi:proteasome lid subunit RPN8/RPN11